MKSRLVKASMVAALCLVLSAGVALATPLDLYNLNEQFVRINNTLGYGTGSGGEFHLDISSSSTNFDGKIDYVSFCLEKYELITTSDVFKIESVSDKVYSGGAGGNGSYDELSSGTKWVFYNYMYHRDVFTSSLTPDALANAIQDVIWCLEKEVEYTSLGVSSESIYNFVISKSESELSKYNNYVKALNLVWTANNSQRKEAGTLAQSQLVATPVPEPTVTMLFALGVVGFAGIARRRVSGN